MTKMIRGWWSSDSKVRKCEEVRKGNQRDRCSIIAEKDLTVVSTT
jgi:hypothetical protein